MRTPMTIPTNAAKVEQARLEAHEGQLDGTPNPGSSAAWRWDVLGRSVRWGGGASTGVFMIGAAGACCGAVPLGLVLAAAGVADLAAGVGAVLLAVASAVAVAFVGLARRRSHRAGSACPAPSTRIGEPTHRVSDAGQTGDDRSSTVL